jgi:hypothetical protein
MFALIISWDTSTIPKFCWRYKSTFSLMIIKRNLCRLLRLKILDIVFYCLSFRALSLKNAGSIYETVMVEDIYETHILKTGNVWYKSL